MTDKIHEDFLQQNPLSFGLYNYYERNDYNLLYINDNPDDLRFNLEIKNSFTETITLSKSTQSDLEAPSPKNYHIELKFRPNQLSQRSREKIDLSEVSKEGWSMSRPYENRDHTVSLFLLKRKDDLVIEKQGTKFITLVGLGANSTEGARVTQLEINYKDFYFPQEKSDGNANAQRRSIDPQTQIIILTVLNFSGKKAASLNVTFAYAPTLLNNGLANEHIVLQIVNIGQEAITLNEKSRFEITIDAQGDRKEPWALAKKDEVIHAKVFLENNPDQRYWIIEEPKQNSKDPTWIIRPNFTSNKEDNEPERLKRFTFRQNEDFFITISNLKSTLRPGVGNLQVAYYNLSGYMDEKRILNVTKTCITERKESGAEDGRIGINKYPDPENHLDVKGKIAAGSLNVRGEVKVDSLNANNIVSARKFEGEGAFVTGMIIMWSGQVHQIHTGWELCNGQHGTPDLRDRFIVGASEGASDIPVPGTYGEADQHNHSMATTSLSTSFDGQHLHAWIADGLTTDGKHFNNGGWGVISQKYQGKDAYVTTPDGSHSHTVNFGELRTANSTGKNRPKWYALCLIMKIA